jgi:hypothetical protein
MLLSAHSDTDLGMYDDSQGSVSRPEHLWAVPWYVQCRGNYHKGGTILGTVQGHYVSNGVCSYRYRVFRTGVYKAMQATCALLNGLVFSSYRFLMKAQMSDAQTTPTLTQIFFAGAGTGIIGSYVVSAVRYMLVLNLAHSIIVTPTELVKVRQQSLLTPISTRQMIRRIVQQDGIRGLYRGITATGLRDVGYGYYFFAVSPLEPQRKCTFD